MKTIKNVLMSIAVLVAVAIAFDIFIENSEEKNIPQSPIIVLYDNDVHCAVDGYAKLVAQREILKKKTPYVSVVSCGDFVSGDIIGAVSKGEHVVKIMNKVGYDIVVLGNHEFNYGIPQMFKLTDSLDASVVSANFIRTGTNQRIFPAYQIINYGDVNIAYVGFTTPESGTVKSLSDVNGNILYSFMNDEFYENAQQCVDEVRKNGADYVVALTHLGDTELKNGQPSSSSLIANTVGIDAVIDGHDHHVISEKFVKNKNGDSVLLTSSGTAFRHIGMLILTETGVFKSSLIELKPESPSDNEVMSFIDSIKNVAESNGRYVVGYSDVDLSIFDSNGNRTVRKQETNIGDFFADAFRIYTKADVAMLNGGGLRASLKKGNITYNDVYSVMPFGNMIYTATMTGQQLLDALEMSVSYLPNEDGSFMQVSGMIFNVNTNIPSNVIMDTKSRLFSHVGNGERRISNLRILDAHSGEFQPVDLKRKYTVVSYGYLLINMGGNGILRYANHISGSIGVDVEIAIEYIKKNLGGRIGKEYAQADKRIIIN